MKKLILLGSLILSANVLADAINTFTWETFSSDDKMYVCNAGIMHADGTTGHVDPNSGGLNSGPTSTTHDYMTVDYSELNDEMEASTGGTQVVREAMLEEYNQYFATTTAFSRRIDKLTINLNSENYGAEYFVDVCYRGSQIAYQANNIRTDYRLVQNQLTYVEHDVESDYEYFDRAGLTVRSETRCDTQLTGRGGIDGLDNEFDLEFWPANESADSLFSSETVELSPSVQSVAFVAENASVALNGSTDVAFNAPRYCVTRYVVKEAVNGDLTQTGSCSCSYGDDNGSGSGQGGATVFEDISQASCNGTLLDDKSVWTCEWTAGEEVSPVARDWSQLGASFTALTEIENQGAQHVTK